MEHVGSISADLVAALKAARLLNDCDEINAVPLAGGISSDIWLLRQGDHAMVVKKALERLRVSSDWQAPLSRSNAEARWLQTVHRFAPNAVPAVLFHDASAGLFVMNYFPPEHFTVWKTELLAGRVSLDTAAAVGATLARIHVATSHELALKAEFGDIQNFKALRIKPYLEATAARHPGVAAEILELARRMAMRSDALVHGDISPKNILVGDGPVFLDAECAWYGDPAFDLAFCLNHLLLKSVVRPNAVPMLLRAFDTLSNAYTSSRGGELDGVEARAALLLPALLLARIDGQSPVEYIQQDADRIFVRSFAIEQIRHQRSDIAELRDRWTLNLRRFQGNDHEI